MPRQTRWVIIGAIIVVAAVAGILYYLNRPSVKSEEQQLEDLSNALEESAGISDLNISTNPVQDLPDTNPVDKTNPFKNIHTNPFQ